MNSLQSPSHRLRLAAFAAAGVAVLGGLSACEERPYSVPTRQAATPAPRTTELAGDPAYAPATPPAYVAPPEQAYAPPPPAQTYHPAPAYDSGEPMIVAMAPIPNPGDGGRRVTPPVEPTPPPVYTSPSRVHHVYGADAGYAHLNPSPRHARVIHVAPTPAMPVARTTHVAAAPTHTVARTAPTHVATAVHARPTVAAKPAPVAAHGVQVATATPKPALRKPVSPVTIVEKPAVHASRTTVASRSAVKPTSSGAPVDADHAAKASALQTALTDAVAKDAVLTLPSQFTPNQPADVSLSLPASFADTLRKEADKQGLAAEAATANMTATLAGEGYAATPADMQAQPLTAGQSTEFHWTVIPQAGAKGTLHADVGADLLGGGSTAFSLGSVQKTSGFRISNQAWGIGLLVLIVLGVLAWLARGVNRPVRDTRTTSRMGDRPLDMGREPPRI